MSREQARLWQEHLREGLARAVIELTELDGPRGVLTVTAPLADLELARQVFPGAVMLFSRGPRSPLSSGIVRSWCVRPL